MPRKKPPAFTSSGYAVCYLRVSTGHQRDSELGLMGQVENCANKVKSLGLRFRSDVHYDTAKSPRRGHFVDAAESAFRKAFLKRPAAFALMLNLNRGDTLVVAKLDRAWRNVADFLATVDELHRRGIRLVVCSPAIDMGTAIGRMLASYLAVVAEFESARKSERIKDALAAKYAQDSPKKPHKRKTGECLESDWRPPERPKTVVSGGIAGRIMVYTRCSHRDSAESGLGMIDQAMRAKAYAESLMEANPNLTLFNTFADAAVSAVKFDLRLRPAGREMNFILRNGDHVVFSCIDRGFRSVRDIVNTVPEWISRGVHVHFAMEGICMDDPAGQLLATVICQFAEMEGQLASERAKESRAQLVSHGRYAGGHLPPFWKLKKVSNHNTVLVLDRKKLVAYRLVVGLKAICGMTTEQALVRCEQLHAAHENRPVIPLGGALRRSEINLALPANYEREKTGTAFPLLTRSRFDSWTPHYQQAIKTWRLQMQHERKIREGCREQL